MLILIAMVVLEMGLTSSSKVVLALRDRIDSLQDSKTPLLAVG